MHDTSGAMTMRRASGPIAAVITLLLLILLAGCSDAPGDAAADSPPPNPLLFEIAAADGTVEGWLFGTIHALPPGTIWETPELTNAATEADLLVVEVAALGDREALARTFATLGTSPGLPPLAERLPAELADPVADLVARAGLSAARQVQTESWAAAIMLAQLGAPGDPANGADKALIARFAGRPVRELEGAAGQLSLFDRLPEAQQRVMLASVVREAERAGTDPERLQRAWLAGDAATIEAATREGFLADPALREALLTARNRRWAAALVPMLKEAPRPLVAVGAAHLVGPDGVAALLAAEGYAVRRLP
jgi:uncharacterized protein YbaP (TraB family)